MRGDIFYYGDGDDLWGNLSFLEKETSGKKTTSGVICPQVGTNYLRGHIVRGHIVLFLSHIRIFLRASHACCRLAGDEILENPADGIVVVIYQTSISSLSSSANRLAK